MTRSRPAAPDAVPDEGRAHVVGIDPGLNRTGYAVMSLVGGGLVLHEAGVIRSTSQRSLAERVAEIGNGLIEVLTEFRPSVLAITRSRSPTTPTASCKRRASSCSSSSLSMGI